MKERKRNRMSGFDYSAQAIYFLTICCHNRIHHFGNIENNEMILNQFGEITKNQLKWLEQQYPYFIIHNFVVMPNHIHILCEISHHVYDDVGTSRDLSLHQPNGDTSVNPNGDTCSHFPIKIKSISELMGAFKTTSSKKIHLTGNTEFQWQRSFHDHIVRNEQSYNHINNYITKNPMNWTTDTLNKNE